MGFFEVCKFFLNYFLNAEYMISWHFDNTWLQCKSSWLSS